MKTLVLASQNQGKIRELQTIFSDYNILSLGDIGFTDDIAEPGDTTKENSKIKALAVLEFLKGKNILNYGVIADDSGLFIDALGGEPGVRSARYAGDHDEAANRKKVLTNLQGKENRHAHFECTITYADINEVKQFTGETHGEITESEQGTNGFGYDSIFYSDDLGKTFGNSTREEKNSVSHRGRAIEMFKAWLNQKD